MSMKQPDASAGLDLMMWSGKGGVSSSPSHLYVHSPHLPFSLYLLTPLCCAPAQQFPALPAVPLGPSHLLFLWPPYPHDLHTSCCPQLSLLMQLALTQPCVSYREVSPSYMGSQLSWDGDACVSLFCFALWLMHSLWYFYTVRAPKSSPTLSQGEGFAPSNTGRKDSACTTATCIRGNAD